MACQGLPSGTVASWSHNADQNTAAETEIITWIHIMQFELPHDKTNKMACVPSKDSYQPRHPPSLIGVFAVHMKKAWDLSYPLSAQRRLWWDWVDAKADGSLRWGHIHFVGFIMRRLKLWHGYILCNLPASGLYRKCPLLLQIISFFCQKSKNGKQCKLNMLFNDFMSNKFNDFMSNKS